MASDTLNGGQDIVDVLESTVYSDGSPGIEHRAAAEIRLLRRTARELADSRQNASRHIVELIRNNTVLLARNTELERDVCRLKDTIDDLIKGCGECNAPNKA